MNTSNIFNAANKLQSYRVSINDFVLEEETIISAEISYSRSSVRLDGQLIFKDMSDINSQIDWKESEVIISYTDIFSGNVEKTFRVMGIAEDFTNKKEKIVTLKILDKFSYIMSTSFLQKGFSDTVINAFKSYVSYLGLSKFVDDIPSGGTPYEFVVPSYTDNLSFFEAELSKSGLQIFQTKKGVAIKHFDALIPSSLEENDPDFDFTNQTDNQLYKNKIYDIIPSHTIRSNVPSKRLCIAYDPETKTTKRKTANNPSIFALNEVQANLQENNGYEIVRQQHLNFDQHKLEMLENFMSVNVMMIVVNGYEKNDVNQIYVLDLYGNKGYVDGQSNGNVLLNGKWVSKKVTDKLVGDSLVQKIELCRSDFPGIE